MQLTTYLRAITGPTPILLLLLLLPVLKRSFSGGIGIGMPDRMSFCHGPLLMEDPVNRNET